MLFERPAWQADAACLGVDPSLFFPENVTDSWEAKRICAGCPVRVECLEFSLQSPEREGVWGGMSERTRRKIISERRRVARGEVA